MTNAGFGVWSISNVLCTLLDYLPYLCVPALELGMSVLKQSMNAVWVSRQKPPLSCPTEASYVLDIVSNCLWDHLETNICYALL